MLPLEIGKLYICSGYFLLLYPDKETAARTTGARAREEASAAAALAAYWTRELGKPVIYADKNIPLLVLNTKGEYIEVLAGDKKGWIVYRDRLDIKEIAYAAA